MTLKDKLKTNVSINTYGEAERFASQCEEIADEFAIGFANWCLKNGMFTQFKITQNATNELLEIYKKEKNL